MFDVAMGSYDGAEICELVGIFALSQLPERYDRNSIGLYRDDGLAAFRDVSGSVAERIKTDIIKSFHQLGLRITIQTNLRIVNFLDVTFNLINGKYYPYRMSRCTLTGFRTIPRRSCANYPQPSVDA